MGRDFEHSVGASRGPWRFTILISIGLVAAAIVLLALVRGDVLPRGFAYAAVPVGLIGAASALFGTLLKARSESSNPD